MKKNLVIKKSGESWIVREICDVNGTTVWCTSCYDNLGRAVASYIKLLLTPAKSR